MPPSYFLLLPRELRDQIYTYVFTIPDLMYIKLHSYNRRPLGPGLMYANHQIYNETTSVLYSKNTFLFLSPQYMEQFLARIGNRNKTLIKAVGILVDCTNPLVATDPNFRSQSWTKALLTNELKGLNEMMVWGRKKKMLLTDETRALMDPELERAIKNQKGIRKLTLKGFEKDERKKFYEDWNVTMKE